MLALQYWMTFGSNGSIRSPLRPWAVILKPSAEKIGAGQDRQHYLSLDSSSQPSAGYISVFYFTSNKHIARVVKSWIGSTGAFIITPGTSRFPRTPSPDHLTGLWTPATSTIRQASGIERGIQDATQVPIFISPRNKVAQLYPQTQGSLYVLSYDSQGFGGGILTHLHAGQFFKLWLVLCWWAFCCRRYSLLLMVCCFKVLNSVYTYNNDYYFLLHVCTCLLTVQLHFSFVYNILSWMHSEYTVNIFSCIKLSVHDSSCFNLAVYFTTPFCRVNFHLVASFAFFPHTAIPYQRIW
jgi:hypothetical protein